MVVASVAVKVAPVVVKVAPVAVELTVKVAVKVTPVAEVYTLHNGYQTSSQFF